MLQSHRYMTNRVNKHLEDLHSNTYTPIPSSVIFLESLALMMMGLKSMPPAALMITGCAVAIMMASHVVNVFSVRNNKEAILTRLMGYVEVVLMFAVFLFTGSTTVAMLLTTTSMLMRVLSRVDRSLMYALVTTAIVAPTWIIAISPEAYALTANPVRDSIIFTTVTMLITLVTQTSAKLIANKLK